MDSQSPIRMSPHAHRKIQNMVLPILDCLKNIINDCESVNRLFTFFQYLSINVLINDKSYYPVYSFEFTSLSFEFFVLEHKLKNKNKQQNKISKTIEEK